MTNVTVYESPLGPLTLTARDGALTGLWFPGRSPKHTEAQRDRGVCAQAIAQLEAYFAGTLRSFELALDPAGTPFQRQVWDALRTIPYGTTTSYGALARRLEAVRGEWVSPRAVGAANGANPISIIVPCHRVIGADGALTGYGGGLHRKQALLEHELGVRSGDIPPAVWAERQIALI